MKNKYDKIGVGVAVGCFIIMFIHLGTLGTAGLFIPQLIKTLNVPVSQVSLNVTFCSLTGFVFSLMVGKLRNKVSIKMMILIGSVAGIMHYLISAMSNGIFLIYLGSIFGGVKFGFGTHACNAAIISQWFNDKKATVIGVVFSGAAFGSAIMMYISGILIESVGWRSTYLVFAALHLFIAIPVNLFVLKEIKILRKNIVNNNYSNSTKSSNFEVYDVVTMKEVYRNTAYWMLLISMMLCGTLIVGFKTFVPSYWQFYGLSALTSSKYISIFMVIATISTMVSGNIADKYGNKAYIIYLYSSFLIGMIFVLLFSNKLGVMYIMIPVIFVAVSYPLYGSIPATVVTESFGAKYYDKVCGDLMAAFFIGQSIASPIIGGLRDITGTYSSGFKMITVFGLTSFLLLLIAIKKSDVGIESSCI
ncbi:MFS transporter [Sedimentibacter sp.]|uniref:MFS transporter n=1 Tax=Sedimentibacter sp. TaxID=1960295 RepID=UPI00289E38C5|nr:MFS transporter [Sedimentibacter sp.]